MKLKKVLGLLLSAVLAMQVAGCSGTQTAKKGEDPNTVPEDTYEIQWYMQGVAQNDIDSVEAKINEYLKDKINATVNIVILESGQYEQKMSNMIAASEYFDIAFAASYRLDYMVNAGLGAFVALDDYLDTYLKDIAAELPESMINSARVNGQLYALPTYKEAATSYGWIYRKDIADKYNIDMTQYKTLEDFKPVAQMLKEKEASIQYPIDWDKSMDFTLEMYRSLRDKPYVVPFNKMGYLEVPGNPEDGTEVEMHYDTDQTFMKKAVDARRDYYVSGLVKKDVATATDLLARFNSGKTFAYIGSLKPGKAAEMQSSIPFEIAQAEITEPKQSVLPGQGSMQVISATSKNPERCARFLNLLNTDPYLKNLVIYGIEGKHHNIVDGKVELIPDSGYDLSNASWAIGNVFIDKLKTNDAPDKLEKLKEFTDNSTKYLADTFVFDATAVDFKIAEVQNAMKEFGAIGALGSVDVDFDAEVAARKEALEKAGIDEIKTEMQKQYDEFIKNNK